MIKRFGIKTLALAAVLAAAVPGVTFARDRDDFRRGPERHEVFRGHDRDWDHDRGHWNFGFGIYAAPTPVPVPVPAAPASGYYDPYGVWHAYAPAYPPYGY